MSAGKARELVERISARRTSDGDGVQLLRVFGGARLERFDPFLLLDEFGSEQASDYIGGFPPHPHRGFETITYMLQGKMEHRDHMGNVGLLKDSDVQWMTAGSGVIHSEMPQQTEGKMRGFQLWLNLPASQKMKPAHYEDVAGAKVPSYQFDNMHIKAIAGQTLIEQQPVRGYFDVADTEPLYLDMLLEPGRKLRLAVQDGYTLLAYVYEGAMAFGEQRDKVAGQTLARFSHQGELLLGNESREPARCILLAGKPLNEPIVQQGPFVMNTEAEIQQAIQDYQQGRLVGD